MLHIPWRLGYRRAGRVLCVIECPCCGSVLASASEPGFLPEYALCDCDEKKYKQEKEKQL